jgi:NitT/TauT family transport system substrate-binding protein
MAKVKINTGGKIVGALLGVTLIGLGVWKTLPKQGADVDVKPEFVKAADGPAANNAAPDKQGGDVAKPADAKPGESTPGLGRPIKVAIVTWGGYAGGIMANNGFPANKDSTFWKEYGIEVELKVIDDYPASRDAFKLGGDKGGVDIMWSTVDSYALEYDTIKDSEPVAIMQYDWSRGGDAVAATKEIQKVADLKGKRLAVAEGTPSHYFALYLLSQADMKTGDVSFVFTASALEAAQLFQQGKVDAAVSWSPDVYTAAAQREGGHILASTREASSLIADIFVARGDFAKKHPELIAKFMLGWFDGVGQVNKDPNKVYDLMAKGFQGVNLESAKGMLGDVKLPSYAENLAFFEVTGDELRGYSDIYGEANKLWRSLGKTSGRTQTSETFSSSFLSAIRPEAEKRFGPVEEAVKATKATQEFKFDFDAAKQEEAKKQEAILTKRISIFFPSGRFVLDENQKFILDEAAGLAQTFGSVRMRVTGNTDSQGDKKKNIDLSAKRAQAVADYMVSKHGFPRDKFVVVGAGPENPIADNGTEEGRQQNRRTDFEIIK